MKSSWVCITINGTFIEGMSPTHTVFLEPLDVLYDGVKLSDLLVHDEFARRTPAQRAAISAHWSAELRAKMGK